MLLIKNLLKDTERIYAERELGEAFTKTPSADRPILRSNQIKALAEAIILAIDHELSIVRVRIKELETHFDNDTDDKDIDVD